MEGQTWRCVCGMRQVATVRLCCEAMCPLCCVPTSSPEGETLCVRSEHVRPLLFFPPADAVRVSPHVAVSADLWLCLVRWRCLCLCWCLCVCVIDCACLPRTVVHSR